MKDARHRVDVRSLAAAPAGMPPAQHLRLRMSELARDAMSNQPTAQAIGEELRRTAAELVEESVRLRAQAHGLREQAREIRRTGASAQRSGAAGGRTPIVM